MENNCIDRFIDIERNNKDADSISEGYERNFVNISHIVRIEKINKSENSKVKIHLIDGKVLTSEFKTYDQIMKIINNLEV